MKAMNDHISGMNDHISDMPSNITAISSNTDKQEEKLTELSSKISMYEDHVYKAIINKML